MMRRIIAMFYMQGLWLRNVLDKLDLLEADLHKILQKNPDDVGALNALGYTLTDKTTRYDEAEKYLRSCS